MPGTGRLHPGRPRGLNDENRTMSRQATPTGQEQDPFAWLDSPAATPQAPASQPAAAPAPAAAVAEPPAAPPAVAAPEPGNADLELMQLRAAVDGATTAMMMVDRDLIVTYVNQATLKLMREHEDEMRRVYPGFSPDALLGSCIDQFHRQPGHQRQLLSNPANLPFRTDINVGTLTFALNVTAITDAAGNYVGNALEWSDVTRIRHNEREMARLREGVDGSTSNIMLCDDELRIVYANPAVMQMFRRRSMELRQVFSGFDPDHLIGQCIDQFHRDPAHQRGLLKDASRLPFKASIKVLDLHFEVNASYISGPDGSYMGNMVEWKDITAQMDAEHQIRGLVSAAARGDFAGRVDVEKYEGFFQQLGNMLNELLATSEQGLTDIADVMRELAEGNLTVGIERDYEGLFGQVKNDVNVTTQNLAQMVSRIRNGAETIRSSAREIARGNTDLSQRTEEQAASLEETASSMEQMTSTVRSSTESANHARQLASGAREQSERGGEVVGQAVNAMGEINQSSKQIAEIIGVIDEIAFQTNLLALNAAVEAARAGDQGRGFAVVAAEVRSLAQRSAQAAKEIKNLIKDSVEKVEQGTRLVDASGKTLTEIVDAFRQVSDIVSEIAAASQEQSSGIEEVNKAIAQLDQVTQQNAALVEEAAASSETLDTQAGSLAELVRFFDTGQGHGGAPVMQPHEADPAPPVAARERRQVAPARQSLRAPSAADGLGSGDQWEEF